MEHGGLLGGQGRFEDPGQAACHGRSSHSLPPTHRGMRSGSWWDACWTVSASWPCSHSSSVALLASSSWPTTTGYPPCRSLETPAPTCQTEPADGCEPHGSYQLCSSAETMRVLFGTHLSGPWKPNRPEKNWRNKEMDPESWNGWGWAEGGACCGGQHPRDSS